ncbi:DNA-binding transcriptional regulator, MerR family [Ferrithrix thermotolerans DSM 19514]|uniref:DNA-binding transcriptional regulator, MerR family n=1 Tax=Ferrithrix thermotolerans DSM 19514 TaxID=1121881 RepID=A0A1M4UFL6_9ACTN|nr:MerR family transcriptional regulator [Ferrithrix thermotolerans]SHE55572.1 DNA-binding transcriptional regulator, MerR family [Ferrithrix thermotolerans DSM 19514]
MSEDVDYLSIGEVLALIKKDFPDVSISKIRYLESQGLIDPERTPSGYRKFYPYDIERLRKVLHLQRDSFLPLKVIKDTLDGKLAEPTDVFTQPTLQFEDLPEADKSPVKEPGDSSRLVDLVSRLANRDGDIGPSSTIPPAELSEGKASTPHQVATERNTDQNPLVRPSNPEGVEESAGGHRADSGEKQSATSSHLSRESIDFGRDDLFSVEELSRLTGAKVSEINEVESYGLIESEMIAGEKYYGRLDFEIVQLVLVFKKYGVSSRHLRMYKLSAEREVGFMEQVITPLLRQRNPQARHKAQEQLSDLKTLGGCLRGYFMERLLDNFMKL